MPLNDGAINQILPFCPDGTEAAGDLLSLAEYLVHTGRLRGHQKGLALREIENRALRQALLMSAGVGQYIANRYAGGVMDNGDLDAIEEGLKSALAAQFPVATTERAGISLRATPQDIAAKTDPNKTVSPADLASLKVNKWTARAIGEPFAIWDHLAGAEIPPTAADGPRFIKLTAADGYNDGLLSGETVSGAAPDITATAVIALADSPLYGQTISLINTERRFLRGGSGGVVEGDAIRNIAGSVFVYGSEAVVSPTGALKNSNSGGSSGNNGHVSATKTMSQIVFDASLVVPTAAENRPRNISATYYLRIC